MSSINSPKTTFSKRLGAQPTFWRYVWGRNSVKFIIVLLILLLLIGILKFQGNAWWDWWEPTITFLILSSTLLAWYMDTLQEWKENLEKRLTVHFRYQNNTIIRCEYAHLAGESDIRPLSQQIGSQVVSHISEGKERWLDFVVAKVEIKPHEPYVYKDREDDKKASYIKHYEAFVSLTKYPESFKKEGEEVLDRCYVWRYPFVDEQGQFCIDDEENA